MHEKGKITRLYADGSGCYFKLDRSGPKPKDDLFYIDRNHENYNSLYSMAMMAATNRQVFEVGGPHPITPEKEGYVVWAFVDWK